MLHNELLAQAKRLLAVAEDHPSDADLRRAISSAYYALFHAIGFHVSNEIVGTAPEDEQLRSLVRRSLKHTDMREALKGFASGNLKSLYKDVVGEHTNPDLKQVANAFTTLQQDRNKADYNISWDFTIKTAEVSISDAENSIRLLEDAMASDGNKTFKKLFIVAMLFHATLKSRD